MKNERSNGALVGGALLIGFGLLALGSQVFRDSLNWSYFWPFFVIIIGLLFFAGMFALGRQASGLAIPGAIITGLGLLLLYQALATHWASWAYSWALLVVFVGAGIYFAGMYGGSERQKQAGTRLVQIGFILFVVFGAFFELLFSAGQPLGYRGLLFPILLILLGVYLILRRTGVLGSHANATVNAATENPLPLPDGSSDMQQGGQ